MSNHSSLLPRIHILSRRALLGLFLAILSSALQLWVGARFLSVSVFAGLFLLLGIVDFRLPEKAQPTITVLVFLCAACLSFFTTQYAQGWRYEYIGLYHILLSILLYAAILLFFLLAIGRPFPALCVGMILFLLFTTVSFYVYSFRGNEFMPLDILSIRTAGNVADAYDFTPNLKLVRTWLLVLLFLFGVSSLHLKRFPRGRLTLVALPLFGVMVIGLFFGFKTVTPYFYGHQGTYYNGNLLNFTLQIGASVVHRPKDYDPDALEALALEQPAEESDAAPTLIVIMNESFADFGVFGPSFSTDSEVMPFLKSLTENSIYGYACSSVFGGNTANSEFEFLTGHSMAFLPRGCVAYQQYIKQETHSLVEELKDRGYTCLAMHPCPEINWSRFRVYPNLGFDESYFIQDFPDIPLLRAYPSDQGMYDALIARYEQRDPSVPLFIFGITMQNHGDYIYDETLYPARIHLNGFSQAYPNAEQYLTLIHDSDLALAQLVDYFRQVDDDVILVFFGDHQPRLDPAFYSELHAGAAESLDETEKEYLIPFVVWANYEIDSKAVPLTSINYLSNYMLEAAGMSLPPYNSILCQIQQQIPAINSLGYYSLETDAFLPLEEATGGEAAAIALYRQFEYNALFDARNRLPMFQADFVSP